MASFRELLGPLGEDIDTVGIRVVCSVSYAPGQGVGKTDFVSGVFNFGIDSDPEIALNYAAQLLKESMPSFGLAAGGEIGACGIAMVYPGGLQGGKGLRL